MVDGGSDVAVSVDGDVCQKSDFQIKILQIKILKNQQFIYSPKDLKSYIAEAFGAKNKHFM